MTLVREDKHGLYVKVGGYIARPQPNRSTQGYEIPKPTCRAGDHVRASHNGGPTARVDGQVWFTHDSYLGDWDCTTSPARYGGDKPSEQCWRP